MSDNSSRYIPASPRSVAIRPLDKGVVNNLSPGMVPEGAFLRLLNWRVGTEGLEHRPVWIREDTLENFVEFPPIQNMWDFWDTSGVKRTLFADRKFLYKVTANSNGVVSTSKLATTNESGTSGDTNLVSYGAGTTLVSGTNTAFTTNDIRVGDVIYVNGETGGRIISQVTSNTALNVATADAFTQAGTGVEYIIQEGFYNTDTVEVVINGTTTSLGNVPYLDATQTGREIIFSDGYRPLKSYDATTFEDFTTSSMVPVCVAYFRDRVFAGQIVSASSGYYRQRIVWSEAGDVQLSNFPSENYQDFPYQQGALWRLVPFGQALAALYDDAIYLGRPTSSSSLPVYFEKVETGGVGLAAMRGVATWMDSLFFVGQNNIYMVTPQEVKPIGTMAVRKELLALGQTEKFQIMGYSDTVNGKIGFALPEINGGDLTHCWEMDIETGAWSKLDFGGRSIGFIKEGSLSMAVTFDGFADTDLIDDYTGRIDNYTSAIGEKRLYLGVGGGGNFLSFASQTESDLLDFNSNPVETTLTSGDIDLDAPDVKKLWNRLAVKLMEQTPADGGDVTFRVEGSTDRGQRWKRLGQLVISPGTDEGKVNFRMVGSQFRFRLSLVGNTVGKITLTEITLRMKSRGRELRFD